MKARYRFSAKIQRGCYVQSIKAVIPDGIGIGNVMDAARSILIRKADPRIATEPLDTITVRISRIKPSKSKP